MVPIRWLNRATSPLIWWADSRNVWKPNVAIRPLVLLALALPLLAPAPRPASAAESEGAFSVSGIAVDTTAESASAAREAARAEGQRTAFRRLVERLAAPGAMARLPQLKDSEIAALIDDFQVDDERTSDVRYIARLSYRFVPEGIRKLFADAGIAYAEAPSEPVLVLPVWRGGGAPKLWDDPNPWREAWAREAPPEGLVPFVVPVGDIDDLGLVSTEQALNGDAAALAAAAERYGAGHVIVAEARPRDGGISATVRRYQSGLPAGAPLQTTVPGGDGALEAAVRAVVGLIEEEWKQAHLIGGGGEQKMVVVVPLGSMADWAFVRRTLTELPTVRETAIIYLSRDLAALDLTYVGGRDQLGLALSQRGLALAPDGADWVLRRAGAPVN
jgi:hypothetical protein